LPKDAQVFADVGSGAPEPPGDFLNAPRPVRKFFCNSQPDGMGQGLEDFGFPV
jgi:hypothetical protein